MVAHNGMSWTQMLPGSPGWYFMCSEERSPVPVLVRSVNDPRWGTWLEANPLDEGDDNTEWIDVDDFGEGVLWCGPICLPSHPVWNPS